MRELTLQKLLFRLQHIPFAPIKLPSHKVRQLRVRLHSPHLVFRGLVRTNLNGRRSPT